MINPFIISALILVETNNKYTQTLNLLPTEFMSILSYSIQRNINHDGHIE